MIQVRRHDDVFATQPGIGAAQDTGHILRFDLRALHACDRLQSNRQREARQRLACIDVSEKLGERMAGVREHLVGVRGVHRHRQLLSDRIVQ